MTDRQFFLGLCATCAAITVAPAAIALSLDNSKTPSAVEATAQPEQSIAYMRSEPVAAPAYEVANAHVRNNLNAADGMFNHGMDGCTSVSIAITAASHPEIYGPTSASDRADVARYAQRCGLRF